MKIPDKRTMYDLQSRLKLGNSLLTWPTIKELRRSSYLGPVAIRSLVPGLGMAANIDKNDLEKAVEEYLSSRRCKKEDIIFSEMAAPSMGIRRLLNGQLTRAEEGIYLEFDLRNIHLNEAMMNPQRAALSRAKLILTARTDPSDCDDLEVLLDEYECPIIEFSVLDRGVGWAKRRMVVWEVRHY